MATQQDDFARMRDRVGQWKSGVSDDFVPTSSNFMSAEKVGAAAPPAKEQTQTDDWTEKEARVEQFYGKPVSTTGPTGKPDEAKDVYIQQPRGPGGKPQRVARPKTDEVASKPAAQQVPATDPPQPAGSPTTGQFYDRPPTLGSSTANGNTGTATFGGPQAEQQQAQGVQPSNVPSVGLPPQPGTGGGGGGSQAQNGGNPSNLPYDMSIEEEGDAWGGYKPDYLPNMPENMPTATHWNVTADQTVAGQMASLMQSDNPVFASLREQVLRAHAAGGGKNSLMASRAAVKMMADMAFQIGSQDAATLARSAEFNAAMDNQFGLAQQQFMHNAMLSEQNFRQGVMILREQNKARLSEIEAEVNGQLAAIGAQASAASSLEDQRQRNTLEVMDRAHGQNLERDELNFQHNWMMAEQGQAHALERSDRETDNTIRAGSANFGWQMQLQYLSETGANGRQLLETIGAIASNPNIKGPQMQGAIRDVTHNYSSLNSALSAAYANAGLRTGGNVPGASPGGSKEGGASSPYDSGYGDYMSYSNPMFGPGRGYSMGQGGYRMTAAPTAQFWGGTGVTDRPMYGSNVAYANQQRPSNPGVGYGAPSRPSGSGAPSTTPDYGAVPGNPSNPVGSGPPPAVPGQPGEPSQAKGPGGP